MPSNNPYGSALYPNTFAPRADMRGASGLTPSPQRGAQGQAFIDPRSASLLAPTPGTGWGGMKLGQGPGDYLPYTQEYDDSMKAIGDMIAQTNTMSAPQNDLNAVRNSARQSAFTSGLDGPLAAQIEANAQAGYIDLFQKAKMDRLAVLHQLRTGLITKAQADEYMRRQDAWMREQQRRAAAAQKEQGMWRTAGTVGGALIGTLVAPGIGTGIGAQLGGGLGDLGYNFFGG